MQRSPIYENRNWRNATKNILSVYSLIDDKGRAVEIFEDLSGLNLAFVSEAHEHGGYLYLASVINGYITRVNKYTQLA